MNNNESPPDAASLTLGMRATTAAINRLGNLPVAFGSLKHRQLAWLTSGDGELSEDIRRDPTMRGWLQLKALAGSKAHRD